MLIMLRKKNPTILTTASTHLIVGDEVPRDFTSLADKTLFGISTSAIPTALRAYEDLHVKHEQLTLITPQFETPLPPLLPAVSCVCVCLMWTEEL